MIDVNFERERDGRHYHAMLHNQVKGPTWWQVTRDDGEHASVPWRDAAGIELSHDEVFELALKQFEEFDRHKKKYPL